MNINNLAIILTKKIERSVIQLCHKQLEAIDLKESDSLEIDTAIMPPSFWEIRATILEVLSEYMEESFIHFGPRHESRSMMQPLEYESYIREQRECALKQFIHMIIENEEIFDSNIQKDELNYGSTLTRNIIFIKTGKLKREAQKEKELLHENRIY